MIMFHLTTTTFMKNKNSAILVIFTFLLSNAFFSCSSPKLGFFNNSNPVYTAKQKTAPDVKIENTGSDVSGASKNSPALGVETKMPVIESAPEASVFTHESLASKPKAEAPNTSGKLTKAEKKEIKNNIKEVLKKSGSNESDINTLLLVIIAILIPPVAVLLVDGLGGPFFLSILLTLLFYLPGLIYALFRIFRQN